MELCGHRHPINMFYKSVARIHLENVMISWSLLNWRWRYSIYMHYNLSIQDKVVDYIVYISEVVYESFFIELAKRFIY